MKDSDIPWGESVKTEYIKTVDKTMCSELCPCPTSAKETWEGVPVEKARESGRIAANLMTSDEVANLTTYGSFNALITPLIFDDPGIKSFAQCYEEKLKPLFDDQRELPEDERDREYAVTMYYLDFFFESGAFDYFSAMEDNYEACASICRTPLFYLTKDVSEGTPVNDCLTATIEDMTDKKTASIVFSLLTIIIWIALFSACALCTKDSEEGDEEK